MEIESWFGPSGIFCLTTNSEVQFTMAVYRRMGGWPRCFANGELFISHSAFVLKAHAIVWTSRRAGQSEHAVYWPYGLRCRAVSTCTTSTTCRRSAFKRASCFRVSTSLWSVTRRPPFRFRRSGFKRVRSTANSAAKESPSAIR
jgi:hypothetical protein